ncbi:MAG: HAD hydrolase-like protein [Deltaproteobacteria bacterium]|nr:HAD hydrolase-like protein [Deltaproteobacteria bacterium]
MAPRPPKVHSSSLLRYKALLIDAFGVLMDSKGDLPGAIAFIELLNNSKHDYFVLSNSGIYNLEQSEANLKKRGFPVPQAHILSSGHLVPRWIRDNGLTGKQILVLGPRSSFSLVEEGGAHVVTGLVDEVDAIILSHQTGFDYVEGIDHAISLVFRSIERGKPLKVLVPNTDIIYPKMEGFYGITAGSLAYLLEKAVSIRFPQAPSPVIYLGKPYAPLFEEARRRTNTMEMVMIGDQLLTDIKGANDFGIDSVLVGCGVTNLEHEDFSSGILPTYVMDDLR